MTDPGWWPTLLLTMAAYRFWRILAYDTITEEPRRRVLSWLDREGEEKWAIFLTCPWCAGFWITGAALAVYCITFGWIGTTSFLTHWLAMSLGVGLIGTRVDTE